MWTINRIVLFYLCFITLITFISPNLEDLKCSNCNDIETNTKKNFNYFFYSNISSQKIIDTNIISVTVNSISNTPYEIYYYDNIKNKYSDNKSETLFYYYMNCKLAHCLQNELNYYIDKIFEHYKSNINIKEYFDKDKRKHLIVIKDNIMHSINLLLKYLDKISYPLINTDLLKSLLSLYMNINNRIIRLNNLEVFEVYTEPIGLEKIIIQIFIEGINDILNFSALNCSIPNKEESLFGYVNKYFLVEEQFNDFFNNVIPMGLNILYCDVERMLLGNIIKSPNFASNELSQVTINFGKNYKLITFKDFFNSVKKSNELEVIFWYLKSVYKTIIKLLCIKLTKKFENIIDTYINEDEFNNSFTKLRFLYSDKNFLSLKMINIFKSLCKINYFDESFLTSMKIALEDYINDDYKNYFEIETAYLKLPKITIDIKMNDENQSLYEFMDNIIMDINEYKCFMQLSMFLNNEYKIYNTSHNVINQKVITFMKNNFYNENNKNVEMKGKSYYSDVNNNYGIVLNLIQNCIKKINSIDQNYDPENNDNNATIGKELNLIINYLTHLANKINDNRFNDIAFNMVPMINIIDEGSVMTPSKYDKIKRLAYVIMSMLIKYGLRLNSNISEFIEYYYDLKNNFIFKSPPTNFNINSKINSIRIKKTLPSFKDLYDEYKLKANDFKKYDSIIKLNWNGEQKTISDIFLYVDNVILSSQMYYALFNVFFAFYISVLFYEIKTTVSLIERIDENEILTMLDKKKIKVMCPEDFSNFFPFYSKLFTYLTENEIFFFFKTNNDWVPKLLGVSIFYKVSSSGTSTISLNNIINNLQQLVNNTMESFSRVFNCFKKIIKYFDT